MTFTKFYGEQTPHVGEELCESGICVLRGHERGIEVVYPLRNSELSAVFDMWDLLEAFRETIDHGSESREIISGQGTAYFAECVHNSVYLDATHGEHAEGEFGGVALSRYDVEDLVRRYL